MKRSLALFAAITLALASFTACSNKDESSSAGGTTTTAAAASASDETTSATESLSEESVPDDTNSVDEPASYSFTGEPSREKIDAEKSEFIGKWECYCYATDGFAVDTMNDYPLYAMSHMEIYDGGKGKIIDIFGGEENSKDIDWNYNDNEIAMVDSNDNSVRGYMSEDGFLVVEFEYEDGTYESYFYRYVDEYTVYDPSAESEDAVESADEETAESTEETTAESTEESSADGE